MRDGSLAVQLISDTCISLRHQGYLKDCTNPHRTQKDHGKSCEPSEDTESLVALVPEQHKALLHVPPPSLSIEVTFKVPRADGEPSECGMEHRTASCLPVIVCIIPLTIICIGKIFTLRRNNVHIYKNEM